MRSIIFLCLILSACGSVPQAPQTQASPSPAPTRIAQPTAASRKVNCEVVRESIALRGRTVSLPADGVFVMESHYATKGESFGGGTRLFPKQGSEAIESHLLNSCIQLKKMNLTSGDCSVIYKTKWSRVWTPAENGLVGQGARGDLKPSVIEEMFQANMMFAKGALPKPGTKFIATLDGRTVVVQMGYEIGPADSKFLGGMTPEPLFFLKGEGKKIRFGRAVDQTIPLGPVNCETKN